MGSLSDVTPATLEAITSEVGARDLFVLRRVEAGRFAHLGGVGRGEGWAGVVELLTECEPHGARAVETRDVVHVRGEQPVRVFGPYWSTQAVLVPVDHDRLVVLGGLDGDAPASDGVLRAAAARAAHLIQDISPAKRLADELEVAHAIKEVLAVEPTTLGAAMEAIAGHVTAALSCELGVLWLRDGDRVAVCERGFGAPADRHALGAAMRDLLAAGLPSCEQDAMLSPLPGALALDGITSWYAVPIGPGAEVGVLLVCHTDAAPRGFTLLCQDLGSRTAAAAAGTLRAAALRERLESVATSAQQQARQDRLTGLGNRLAWDEAAARCAEPLAVVYVDVDELKVANDNVGHHAGDALLRAMAEVLREATRSGDVVARLGGDEFAVLLPGADGLAVRAVVERLHHLIAAHAPVSGCVLAATIGMSCAPPQAGAEGALRVADAIVCAEKAHRGTARRQPL